MQICVSEEQLDRELPEGHPDGRLGRALERVLAHVEQGDPAALEPRAQLGDARAGVRASAVLVDAAERAAHQVEVGDLRVPQDGSELADALGADTVEGEVERGHLAQG